MSETPAPLPDSSQPAPEADRSAVHDPLSKNAPAAELARAAAEGLSNNQRKVMTYIAAGNSIAKAVKFGAVGRRTVYRWLKEDANFAAVYNAWRRELAQSAQTRLLAMADDAIDTIHGAILTGNVTASLAVAKSMGLLAKPRIGPDDPERLARKRRAREMRQTAADLRAIDRAREDLPYNHPARHTPEEWARIAENDRRRQEEHEKERQQQPEWMERYRQASQRRPNARNDSQEHSQADAGQASREQPGAPEIPEDPQP